MKIKTKLNISIILYLSTALVIAFLTFLTLRQTNNASLQLKSSNEISKGVFELNILTSDYLLHHRARSQIQWKSKHEALQRLLSKIDFRGPEEQIISSRIRELHQAIKFNFYY